MEEHTFEVDENNNGKYFLIQFCLENISWSCWAEPLDSGLEATPKLGFTPCVVDLYSSLHTEASLTPMHADPHFDHWCYICPTT